MSRIALVVVPALVTVGGCALVALGGCKTHVVVEQPKPLEIRVHLTANLNVVIQDARQNLEQITGEKPRNVVRPEDIGLPAAPRTGVQGPGMGGGGTPTGSGAVAGIGLEGETFPVMLRTRAGGPAMVPVVAQGSEAELTRSMAARNPQIQALWAQGLVGEAHTGLLVARGNVSGEQQQLMSAENADRTALYAAEAARKGVKTEEVALGYYVARLGYAKPGAWYEVRNPSNGQWEWKRWGS